MIAILKPGKDPQCPNSYRPISLHSDFYKIYERLILNRLNQIVEPLLIPQQAGFRPGKNGTSQVLNLMQHIEDGLETRNITGVTFIDLTAAYDTINSQFLLKKFYNLTGDVKLTRNVDSLLQNRRFVVDFQGQCSIWRTLKNSPLQRSVLAPMLFNIYMNDQPPPENAESFAYADDLAIAAQAGSFESVEKHLSEALQKLDDYYRNNHLKPNPSKTQLCAFHLRNREASRRLDVSWRETKLDHCATPKYFGGNTGPHPILQTTLPQYKTESLHSQQLIK